MPRSTVVSSTNSYYVICCAEDEAEAQDLIDALKRHHKKLDIRKKKDKDGVKISLCLDNDNEANFFQGWIEGWACGYDEGCQEGGGEIEEGDEGWEPGLAHRHLGPKPVAAPADQPAGVFLTPFHHISFGKEKSPTRATGGRKPGCATVVDLPHLLTLRAEDVARPRVRAVQLARDHRHFELTHPRHVKKRHAPSLV